jgi:YbbR domain-containing protein
MRDWIAKDFGWKMFSVFLALVIWLTVHKIREEPETSGTSGAENTYGDLPVLAVSATADVHEVRIYPNKVDVKVSGPPDIMATLQANRLHAFVNLTGIDSAHDLQRAVEVSLPRDVTLISIDPPQLIVTIPKNKTP